MKDVPHREIGKRNADRTGQPDTSAPACTKLQLVPTLLFYRPVDIHRTVILVGVDPRGDFLLVKESEVGNLPLCSDDIRPAELVTRDREQLSADNIFIGLIVTGYRNILYSCLRAFRHPDLIVDRIIIYSRFHGVDAEKQIAVILIEIAYPPA